PTPQPRRRFPDKQHVHFKPSRLDCRVDVRDLKLILLACYRDGSVQSLRYTGQVYFVDGDAHLVTSHHVDLPEALTRCHDLAYFQLRPRQLPVNRCTNDKVVKDLPYALETFFHPFFGSVQFPNLTYPGNGVQLVRLVRDLPPLQVIEVIRLRLLKLLF